MTCDVDDDPGHEGGLRIRQVPHDEITHMPEVLLLRADNTTPEDLAQPHRQPR
jgi:hypothetical protein